MPPFSQEFRTLAARKTREAEMARLDPLTTIEDRSAGRNLDRIGSDWTRQLYGGDFLLPPVPAGVPAVSLVFVQSLSGNTGAANPDDLGGGATDKHLIYEGLSRVAADGVLAGATTATGSQVFFSVWHPEMVALRASLSRARHPAQIVVSNDGRVDLDGTLLFNVPDVPVFVLAGAVCRDRCARGFARRPWITIIPMAPDGIRDAMAQLRGHGIDRVSAIGGRTTGSSLVDAGLVQDLCLTTTAREGGEPDTPFYVGKRPPVLDLVIRKANRSESPIRFEQFAIE